MEKGLVYFPDCKVCAAIQVIFHAGIINEQWKRNKAIMMAGICKL